MKSPELGIRGRAETRVCAENTAAACASGALPVFATPFMIALMENAAHKSLEVYLEEGEGSVGTALDVKHLAATPLGMEVYAECEIIEVDRRRVVFKVEAFDEKEKIGEGIHERYVVNIEKFMGKCEGKK